MENIRGLYGFRFNGEDKLTYKPDDAEPEKLGRSVIGFCAEHPESEMRKICGNIYGGQIPVCNA